jgi:hypothetical protein
MWQVLLCALTVIGPEVNTENRKTDTMGLTILFNRVSFLPPPVLNNIFYEIETSTTGIYNTGLVHSLQEGIGPRFGEKPLKTMENLGLGPHICPLF